MTGDDVKNFEVWPGPMEGVGKGGFITAVNRLKLVPQWMTPFFRISHELPRLGKMKSFLEPFKQGNVPVAVQLMGTEPQLLGKAAQIFAGMDISSININFGCPSSRVISSGAGGGALRHPGSLADFCMEISSFLLPEMPLSVKLRSGWESPEEMETILPLLADCPAVSKIFFHHRTVREMYCPVAPEERLRRFCRAVELAGDTPVVINGDIDSVEYAEQLIDVTGAAGVMIARPWMCDPWLLRRFADRTVPESECGREKFFAEAAACQVPRGGLIELARMLWGSGSDRFRELLTSISG